MPIQVKQRGFTLIELMVIIALVAIMAGVAVPSFTRFVNNNRVTTQADEIHRFLQYARGEAVVRRQEQGVSLASDAFEVDGANRVLEISPHLTVKYSKNSLLFRANGTASEALSVLVCSEDGDKQIAQMIEVSKSGRISKGLRERRDDCDV